MKMPQLHPTFSYPRLLFPPPSCSALVFLLLLLRALRVLRKALAVSVRGFTVCVGGFCCLVFSVVVGFGLVFGWLVGFGFFCLVCWGFCLFVCFKCGRKKQYDPRKNT